MDENQAQVCQDNDYCLALDANPENLSENAHFSSKTVSYSPRDSAQSESPVSLSEEQKVLIPQESFPSDSCEKINIDNESLIPSQADSCSEASSDSLSSSQTVISMHGGDTSARRDRNMPENSLLSALYVNTTLANESFECSVIANNPVHPLYVRAPGYSVCKDIESTAVDNTHSDETLSAIEYHRRPIDEFLEYFGEVNTNVCIPANSITACALPVCGGTPPTGHITTQLSPCVQSQDVSIVTMSADDTYHDGESSVTPQSIFESDDQSQQDNPYTYQGPDSHDVVSHEFGLPVNQPVYYWFQNPEYPSQSQALAASSYPSVDYNPFPIPNLHWSQCPSTYLINQPYLSEHLPQPLACPCYYYSQQGSIMQCYNPYQHPFSNYSYSSWNVADYDQNPYLSDDSCEPRQMIVENSLPNNYHADDSSGEQLSENSPNPLDSNHENEDGI